MLRVNIVGGISNVFQKGNAEKLIRKKSERDTVKREHVKHSSRGIEQRRQRMH